MDLPRVVSPVTHCPLCLNSPQLITEGSVCQVLGLSYATGFEKLGLQRRRCGGCRFSFLGCWAYPPGAQSRVKLACHPDASPWFLFRERIHAGSFVALHTDYLRFMTASFLFLRASFSGLVKTVHAMFPGKPLNPNDTLRCLEHGWFLHNALVQTWSDNGRVGHDFDLRLDSLDSTLTFYEPHLVAQLHTRASEHHCTGCANPVLTGDGGMKLTTALCNERTSASFTSPELGMTVSVGCTCRPCPKSLFCRNHQLNDAAADALPPEIREHKRSHGSLHFRYAGTDEFLPVQRMSLARLRQYDSRLALLDYSLEDPGRFDARGGLQEARFTLRLCFFRVVEPPHTFD